MLREHSAKVYFIHTIPRNYLPFASYRKPATRRYRPMPKFSSYFVPQEGKNGAGCPQLSFRQVSGGQQRLRQRGGSLSEVEELVTAALRLPLPTSAAGERC